MDQAMPELSRSVLHAFERNFRDRGELGASVSIYVGEKEVVHLAHGHANRERTRPWTAETLVPVWSATKGPAAVAAMLALDEAMLPLESPVCEVWPRFAGAGKEGVSFLHVLTHTAGLCALDQAVPIHDYHAVVGAIEQQSPIFPPGTRQAYHARTFGFLLDEIVQRITGASSLGEYFNQRIAEPMRLDFWIGLPQQLLPHVATLYPGKVRVGSSPDPFLQAYNTRGTLTQRAFASPAGLAGVQDLNQAETLTRGYASMGGVGTARSLAAFYAMLANHGWWGGQKLVSEWIIQAMETTYSQQDDGVLCTPMAFGAGVMRDPLDAFGGKLRKLFGSSYSAFGHPGAGGSHAFADPERNVSFAYVMNQMELGALPNDKTLSLVEAMDSAV